MAISLPILISIFGFTPDALLPILGFLIGVMKGATVGGAVPAILFNTPGTPDAYMTTLDGHPMALNGQAGKVLRVAHFSSASGDTFSDIVLILCAPFLAVMVEAYLDLPEKTALLILSLAFISSVIGRSVGKGLISMGLGLLVAYVGTGDDFYPRLSFGTQTLADGFPVATVILGVLILGEVFPRSSAALRISGRSAGSPTGAPAWSRAATSACTAPTSGGSRPMSAAPP
ncbi:tripartite tricarboxylate transporter permease [Psychromarinibacter sp. C21-152]|uniref:Tripartite tricarboxylate transporter permease n=2 Tax=Psychromarinibacter sediminicola TaxID=3033385 RepID=A0AAE3T7E9_9RHOB|nr:tripartite tricarboxylate transporter permease [Psychromarinibacter sediminicola]